MMSIEATVAVAPTSMEASAAVPVARFQERAPFRRCGTGSARPRPITASATIGRRRRCWRRPASGEGERRLRRINDVLRAASAFFASEIDLAANASSGSCGRTVAAAPTCAKAGRVGPRSGTLGASRSRTCWTGTAAGTAPNRKWVADLTRIPTGEGCCGRPVCATRSRTRWSAGAPDRV